MESWNFIHQSVEHLTTSSVVSYHFAKLSRSSKTNSRDPATTLLKHWTMIVRPPSPKGGPLIAHRLRTTPWLNPFSPPTILWRGQYGNKLEGPIPVCLLTFFVCLTCYKSPPCIMSIEIKTGWLFNNSIIYTMLYIHLTMNYSYTL